MRIGIDIDGCMTDEDAYRLAYVYKYCMEKGLPEPDRPHAYEHKATWWDHEMEIGYRPYYHDNYYRNADIRYCCKEVIDKLREEGHEIYLITGRYPAFSKEGAREEMIRTTKEWLEKKEVAYDRLIFTEHPKAQNVLKEDIDIMMDDYEGVLRVCAEKIPVFCYDCMHNQGLELPNMTRVYSWYDFYRKFHEMFID